MADVMEFVLSTSVPPEVGRITRDEGDVWTITWADGRVLNAKRGSNALRRVREGTLAARYAEDPHGFAAWFAADPVEAFVASLKDEGDEAKAAAIQQRLAAFGLSADNVKAAWTKHKKEIDRHPHVITGSGRGLLRWSSVAQDPLAWIDALSLVEAIKALAAPKVSPAEKARLEARVATAPAEEWGPSEALLSWATGLEAAVPSTDQAAYIRLDDKSLQRVLAKAEADHANDVLRLLARLPTSSKTVVAAFEQLDAEAKWELGTEALAALSHEGDAEDVDSACAVLERLAAVSDPVPGQVPALCLRLRLGSGALTARVDGALEAFLTATLVPLERLRGELESWDEIPREGLVRGDLSVGSFRLRVLTALLTTRHEPVLRRPTTWAGLGLDAVEELSQRQHPLVDTLLSDPEAPGTRVARSWLRAQPASAATLGRALAWSKRLREAVPRPELDSLVSGVRSSDDGVRELLEDPALPALRSQLGEQDATSQRALSALARERDEALDRLKGVTDQLEWAHERMSGAVTDADRALAAELRQAQIDAVRALCQVLDVVYEHDNLSRPVWSAAVRKAASLGISVVGEVGQSVDPESRRFEVVDPPARGQCVVRRPGYEWKSGEEEIVILRALVSSG